MTSTRRAVWLTAAVAMVAGVACVGPARPTEPPVAPRAAATSRPIVVASPTVTATPRPGPAASATAIWRPDQDTRWQWQLNGQPIDTSFDVDMYDIDLFDNSAEVVAALHRQGRKVVCYVDMGGWESWRPDAGQYPGRLLGKPLDDWEGERWLDIRGLEALAPVLLARMDMCADKGFDALEPDNIDGYLNDTGFPLTYQDQLTFNLWLADQAHQRGLSIGLKNDMDQVPDLLEHFDWALNEQCFFFDECDTLLPFYKSGQGRVQRRVPAGARRVLRSGRRDGLHVAAEGPGVGGAPRGVLELFVRSILRRNRIAHSLARTSASAPTGCWTLL